MNIAAFKYALWQAIAQAVPRGILGLKCLGGYAAPRVKLEPDQQLPGSCAGPEQLFLA